MSACNTANLGNSKWQLCEVDDVTLCQVLRTLKLNY